jgi:hypothetical protein
VVSATALAGTLVAGTLVGGTLVGGTVLAGTVLAGTGMAGTGMAGTGMAGTAAPDGGDACMAVMLGRAADRPPAARTAPQMPGTGRLRIRHVRRGRGRDRERMGACRAPSWPAMTGLATQYQCGGDGALAYRGLTRDGRFPAGQSRQAA